LRRAAAFVLLLCLATGRCDRRVDVDFNYAFEHDDLARAQRLLDRGADVNARFINAEGFTTLMMAVKRKDNAEGVAWLLARGADPDLANFKGRTALHLAARDGRAEHVELLLEAGVEVNARDERGETPLQYAHDGGHVALERMLRDAGGTY
jgi:ankyrin repeat protein